MAEITPTPSVDVNLNQGFTKVCGGLLGTGLVGRVLRYNLHENPVLAQLLTSFEEVIIEELDVFVAPTQKYLGYDVMVNIGWGHCEHAYPVNVIQIAQLPASDVIILNNHSFGSLKNLKLSCPFGGPISNSLKPIELKGGRPSLFVCCEGESEDGKPFVGDVVRVYFKIKLKIMNFDISFA